MAAEYAIFIGWNRSFPGREDKAVEIFGAFVNYLNQRRSAGEIESYEPVLLGSHGGDLNGFFLIRGERAKLDKMAATDEFMDFETKAAVHLDKIGVVRAFVGEGVPKQLARLQKLVSG
jgi:hypothetical protein